MHDSPFFRRQVTLHPTLSQCFLTIEGTGTGAIVSSMKIDIIPVYKLGQF